jgi:hypothetical protein
LTLDPGCKNSDPGSGINIPDLEHWKNVQYFDNKFSISHQNVRVVFIFIMNWPPGSRSIIQEYGSTNPDPGQKEIFNLFKDPEDWAMCIHLPYLHVADPSTAKLPIQLHKTGHKILA